MSIVFGFLAFTMMIVVAGGVYGTYVLLNPTRTASDRLREMHGEREEDIEIDLIKGEDEVGGLLGRVSGLAAPASEEDKSIMRRQLVQAGYKHRHALEIFNFTRIALALGLPLVALPVSVSQTLPYMLGITVAMVMFGYWAPYMLVKNAVDKRKKALLNSFPDSLDLLVSSVEAGLGLDAAFRRVASEIEQAAPELSHEFQLVNNEIGAGVPRVEALRRLERRTGLDEIRSLVNMLAQAERFGTSIAASLRVHATVTRQKRMARAEEEAAKVSPKLTVIMILFLLPVLGLLLLGPAVIRAMEMMGRSKADRGQSGEGM